jgi:hypothetical protein
MVAARSACRNHGSVNGARQILTIKRPLRADWSTPHQPPSSTLHMEITPMTRRIALLLVAFSFVSVSSASFAQGTPEERAACRGDVRRLCAKVAGGDQFEVLSCLQSKRNQLSRACKKVLASHGQLGGL